MGRARDLASSLNAGVVFNEGSADVDFRVESNGLTHALFVDGGNDKVMIGLETPETFNGTTPPLQIEGTDNNSGSLSITRNSNDNGQPLLIFSKSRGTAVNSDTIVQDNDVIGQIVFLGADGTDRNSQAATIDAVINGTPGSDDMPGELIFRTTTDGTASATERMKIDAVGDVTISTGDIIFGTSAKGINLGVTANTDSNTLDDYEEGTFSMSENNGTGVGVTQDDTQYTKIGRLVVLYADYAIGSNSASGVVSFSSVPFTASSDLSQKADTFTSATTDPIMFVLGANLNSVKANATANLVYSELSGKFIRVNLQYQLASG